MLRSGNVPVVFSGKRKHIIKSGRLDLEARCVLHHLLSGPNFVAFYRVDENGYSYPDGDHNANRVRYEF
ncbi:MAG TPA: hypothetical protein VH088_19345 [Terriglobales bacterium]|nr:hypothetical protein [Terriglobales bacterium]